MWSLLVTAIPYDTLWVNRKIPERVELLKIEGGYYVKTVVLII